MPSPAPTEAAARLQDTVAFASDDSKSKCKAQASPTFSPAGLNGISQPQTPNDGSTNSRVRLPFDAPAYILHDTVYVTSPDDIATETRRVRSKRFDELFSRYMNQIQYGCKNPNCTTPTCLSCRRRQNKVPLRKYTALSARALAYAQISERDPEAGLCHNAPNGPERLPEYRDSGQKLKRRSDLHRSSDDQPNGYANGDLKLRKTRSQHKSSQPGSSPRHAQSRRPSLSSDPQTHMQDPGRRTSIHSVRRLSEDKAPTKRDPKSFTQSLFDSLPFRLLQWIPLSARYHEDASNGNVTPDDESLGRAARLEEQETRNFNSPSTSSRDEIGTKGDRHQDAESSNFTNLKRAEPSKPFDNASSSSSVKESSRKTSAHSDHSPVLVEDHRSKTSVAEVFTKALAVESIPPLTTEMEERSDLSELPPASQSSASIEEVRHRVPTLIVLSQQSMHWMCQRIGAGPPRLTLRHHPPGDGCFPTDEDVRIFIDQSLYFCLKSPRSLINSVRDWHKFGSTDATPLQQFKLVHYATFALFMTCFELQRPVMVFQHLLRSVQQAYSPPPWLHAHQQRRQSYPKVSMEASQNDTSDQHTSLQEKTHLDDHSAALICALCLFVLTCPFILDGMRQHGGHNGTFIGKFPERILHSRLGRQKSNNDANGGGDPIIPDLVHSNVVGSNVDDYFDDMSAFRLFETAMEVVNIRLAFQEMAGARRIGSMQASTFKRKGQDFSQLIVKHLEISNPVPEDGLPSPPPGPILQRCKLLISSTWNGIPVLRRASPIGGCLSFLASLYKNRQSLKLEPEHFYMDFLAPKLDPMEMPVEWLAFRPNNKEVHLLSYSFLFEPSTLVTYFRAVNFSIMSKSFEAAAAMAKCVKEWAAGGPNFPHSITLYGADAVYRAVRPHMAQYFVLTIRRDNVLTDAINQIWRRQRRELMRPLKVLLGNNEGEEGIDVGGVQQEFFVVLMAEALNPHYGMFTLNEKNRMSWFQPTSMEPLYKFEVLGILFSIAVYNSITLPITFPLAFYRKLLGLKVKTLRHISDGWPELAKGLQEMLDWTEGDVSDVFMRTYEFTCDAFGARFDIDMKKVGRDDPWPLPDRKKGKEKAKTATFDFPPSPQFTPDDLSPPPSPVKPLTLSNGSLTDVKGTSTPISMRSDVLEPEAPLVTNANREQFVKDYVFWLTDKSIRPQFDAFAKGFYTCLDRAALSMFTAEALKTVIEGHQHIDIEGLQKVATYEDYTPDSPTVRAFWEVVKAMSPEQHAQLLEFVTATDRVPVNGIGSVTFRIQKNGYDDVRLPTSSTCFGTLLLPEYSSKAVLEDKLLKAIVNTKGFGVG